MGEEATFTRDQMETMFARRQNERRQLLEDAKLAIMAELKPALDEMTAEIGNANHVKQELGTKIEALTASVTTSNLAVAAHTQLAAHPIGQRLIEEIGLHSWSLEQKQALKTMVEEHLTGKRRRIEDDRRLRRRQAWLITMGTIAAAIAALIGGLIAKLA